MMPRFLAVLISFAMLFAAHSVVGSVDDPPVISRLSPSLEVIGMEIRNGDVIFPDGGVQGDLLVHIDRDMSPMDRISDLGFEIGYYFDCLDVYHIQGPVSRISDLAAVDGVRYIEYNAPGKFDMDVSSGIVGAPAVWSSLIKRGETFHDGVTGEGYSIAVVDSGIDAGHPDLDFGIKTIKNIKAVRAGDPWVEMENTDTSVGHGSHCAGIAAGNGQGSAGSRKGVAPGANLVGLSLTEGDEEISTANYLYGLEWVFENSRPGSNPYDIRICTNSWHTTVGEYEPEMALSRIINRLTYENNVICTFSAGNDGRIDPEGNEVWTSQQGNVPGAIMVAAYARDGSYVAEFTSHGKVGWNHTYADVGAPGVRIWASHARRTGISAGSKMGGNPNPYYLAISGTSMSTPHVAGAVALLLEACPSLDISEVSEDYNGSDPEWFHDHEFRFVHEVELILEASATPLDYVEGQRDETGIFVDDPSTGWHGREIDYTQGYGMIDIEKAVGIALTLRELRSRYRDRHISVFSAIEVFQGCMDLNATVGDGKLVSSWEGEYSRFNDQNGKPLIVQNQTKHLYIPEGTKSLTLTLEYDLFSLSDLYVGGITVDVDTDMDGELDTSGGIPIISRPGTYEIPVSGTGSYYGITVRGQGLKLTIPSRETSYVELRIPYKIRAELEVKGNEVSVPRNTYVSSMNAFIEGRFSHGPNGTLLGVRVYDPQGVRDPFEESSEEPGGEGGLDPWAILVILTLLAALSGLMARYLYKKKKRG